MFVYSHTLWNCFAHILQRDRYLMYDECCFIQVKQAKIYKEVQKKKIGCLLFKLSYSNFDTFIPILFDFTLKQSYDFIFT